MTPLFNRTAIYVSLALALALIFGVIFGSKYVFENIERAPVAMSPVDSPEAASAECAALIDALPEKFMGHPRATVADPVPEGVAAWSTNSGEAVTLRCGVPMPYQYTPYAHTTDVDGTTWLKVRDLTPGSTLTTWYTADRSPVVAVTTFDDQEPTELDLDALTGDAPERFPAALATLKTGPGECAAFLDAAPRELGDYTRLDQLPEGTAKNTLVWTADGREPIELRCGVEDAPGYQAGAQLQQVNDVPWFEDTTLAGGTTASTWFALGRDVNVALSVPQDVAADALVDMSDALTKTTKQVAN